MPALAAFHDVLFPLEVAFGSTGGPERRTEIVALGSGHEVRNTRWADSRRRYDAGTGIRSLDDLHAVIAFFEERRGRLHGFRWRDPVDDRSTVPSGTPGPLDQVLGTGTGALAAFQLQRRYGTGPTAWSRTIAKPVAGSVRVAVAGVERTAGTDFTVDAATGLVTFAPGSIPPAGAAVTAGFRFDVPVRFDTDEIRVDLAAFRAGEIPSVPLVEIRP
jgi:uncharacterized protein (TIGR02217 family)